MPQKFASFQTILNNRTIICESLSDGMESVGNNELLVNTSEWTLNYIHFEHHCKHIGASVLSEAWMH